MKKLISIICFLVLFSSCGIFSFLKKVPEPPIIVEEHFPVVEEKMEPERKIVTRPSAEDLIEAADRERERRKEEVRRKAKATPVKKKQPEKDSAEQLQAPELSSYFQPRKVVKEQLENDTITLKMGEKKVAKIIIKKEDE